MTSVNPEPIRRRVMTVLASADIRSYYHQLGIHLPERARREASVRCFADRGAHRREDRDPSCSINLTHGAWKCHGCGARGGAYDAALAKGYTPRAAIDLMIAHGLIERHPAVRSAAEPLRPRQPAAQLRPRGPQDLAAGPTMRVAEGDIARWQTALPGRRHLLARLARERGWRHQTMNELELGLDRELITIPIRNDAGKLRGLLRYAPLARHSPKMRAAPGTRLGLIPHPTREPSEQILLVEGPPDMIAARSRGLPAIAVPGANAWQPTWAGHLAGRHVTIVMDCDPAGRHAAQEIATALTPLTLVVEIVDLRPDRNDGYDLTDWLIEHPQPVDVDRLEQMLVELRR